MKSQPITKSSKRNDNILNMAALKNERKRQKEETLRWISDSALSKFRHAWGN